MANAKIHINLSLGLIEAEGEEAFVRTVYENFKSRLEAVPDDERQDADSGASRGAGRGATRRSRSKGNSKPKAASSEGGNFKSIKPTMIPDLDLKKLKEFMELYDPQNHSDRTVLFVYFLKEELKTEPCTADQIFTCYRVLKEKAPVAFGQHLIDTRGKKSFISYTTANDIRITTIGTNHVEHDLLKNKANAA